MMLAAMLLAGRTGILLAGEMGGFDIDVSPGDAGDEVWWENSGGEQGTGQEDSYVREEETADIGGVTEAWGNMEADYGGWSEDYSDDYDGYANYEEGEDTVWKESVENAVENTVENVVGSGDVLKKEKASATADPESQGALERHEVPQPSMCTPTPELALSPTPKPVLSATPVPTPSPAITPENTQELEEDKLKSFLYYNNHNILEGRKEAKNYKVDFHHKKNIAEGEILQIEIRSECVLSVLSLRLNGKECPWHWEGNRIVLESKIKKGNNKIELLAALDGAYVTEMPAWIF